MRPFGRTVWSGGLVMLLREFGFSDGAARAALTRLVRRESDRARAVRAARPLPADPAVRAAADRGRRADLHARPSARGRRARGPCSGTRSPRIAGSSGPGSGGGCASSGSARCRTASGSRPTITPPRSSSLLGELGVAERRHRVRRARRAPAPAAGLPALVARAWDLSGLEERYDAFCSGFERYLAPDAPALSDREAFLVRTRLMHMFRGVRPARPRAARGARAAVGAAHAGGGDLRGAVHGAGGGVAAALRRGDARTRGGVIREPRPIP